MEVGGVTRKPHAEVGGPPSLPTSEAHNKPLVVTGSRRATSKRKVGDDSDEWGIQYRATTMSASDAAEARGRRSRSFALRQQKPVGHAKRQEVVAAFIDWTEQIECGLQAEDGLPSVWKEHVAPHLGTSVDDTTGAPLEMTDTADVRLRELARQYRVAVTMDGSVLRTCDEAVLQAIENGSGLANVLSLNIASSKAGKQTTGL